MVIGFLPGDGRWYRPVHEMNVNHVPQGHVDAPAHECAIRMGDVAEAEGIIPIWTSGLNMRMPVMQGPLGTSNFLAADMVNVLSKLPQGKSPWTYRCGEGRERQSLSPEPHLCATRGNEGGSGRHDGAKPLRSPSPMGIQHLSGLQLYRLMTVL
jgi:hypothetical protein